MWKTDRRTFLTQLSRGILAAGLGATQAPRAAWALAGGEGDEALDFGELEELAALMQETEPFALQERLANEIRAGAALSRLVAAGALANARTFGGEDYTGYHCLMAMVPALEMARLMHPREAPLPVLKVLFRSAARIREQGGRESEVLGALATPEPSPGRSAARAELRAAFLARDVGAAERAFASLSAGEAADAFDDVQSILHENLDVHRVVLAWRAWETLAVTGDEHARTLLRQSVRFCIRDEERRLDRGRPTPELRTLLPALVEEHGLTEGATGTRHLSDGDLEKLAEVFFGATKADAARAAAERLGEGLAPHDVGEALSLAANKLLLHDPGRQRDDTPEKPRGSVHGASTGLHASDAARAWRNIGNVSNPSNAVAALIAGAYHTAGQSAYVSAEPFSYEADLDAIETENGHELLRELRRAIEGGDQTHSMAVTHRYATLGNSERPLFKVLLDYAVESDGALHAEKYFQTVCEEFREARPAFRRNHLVALARVTASQYGWEAPGMAAAREHLGV